MKNMNKSAALYTVAVICIAAAYAGFALGAAVVAAGSLCLGVISMCVAVSVNPEDGLEESVKVTL